MISSSYVVFFFFWRLGAVEFVTSCVFRWIFWKIKELERQISSALTNLANAVDFTTLYFVLCNNHCRACEIKKRVRQGMQPLFRLAFEL